MALDIAELNRQADEMLQSAVKVLNTPVATPGYKGTDLSGVRKEVARASATRDVTSKAIDDAAALEAKANEEKKAGLDAKAKAEGEGAFAKQQQSQMVADQHRLFAEMFGMTVDPSSEIAANAKMMNAELPKARAKLAKLQEMQGVSFLDDPLEYLYNMFQIPAAAQDYNRHADIVNSIQTDIDNRIRNAGTSGEVGAKGVPTIITSQAKAVADLALADAAIAKANADEMMAKTNVDFATKKLSGDLSIASATMQSTQLQITESHNRFQAQLAAIQAADTRATRLLTAAKITTQMAENEQLKTVILANYDRIIGKPPGSTTPFLYKSFSDEQQKNIAAIAAGSAGANPYEAFINVTKSIPGDGMSPETQSTVIWMQQKLRALNTAMDTAQVPKELRGAKFAESLQTAIKQEQEQAYKKGTLFHEVEPAKLIAAGLIAPDSQLAKILDPLTKSNAPMEPEIIVKTIAAQLTNPTEAGAAIAEYYQANMTFMNNAANFKLLKIPLMTSYKVPAAKGIFGLNFGETLPVYDLMRPEEATKYVLKLQIKEKLDKSYSGSSGRFTTSREAQ